MCRKSHCIELLGEGLVALHSAAIPSGYRAGAIFWRDLWLAGKGLNDVRWWRNGATQLKASVDRVHTLSWLVGPPSAVHALMCHACFRGGHGICSFLEIKVWNAAD